MTSAFLTTRQLDISGVVQGVGFRPFVFSLAKKYRLNGVVSNTADGVSVLVQGDEADLDGFCRDIEESPPLLASITQVDAAVCLNPPFSGFQIVKSKESHARNTLISPDVSICPDCLSELTDPSDRRFEYPFINCTNCGPRFTIIEDIPYDRPKTSMKVFDMCPQCLAEYEDPSDRRFHAQPNACPECGPHVFLTYSSGTVVSEVSKDAIEQAAALLKKGHILGIKGLGGFHLACDASNERAVVSLREKKRRPHKPFALMARSADVIAEYLGVSELERSLLESYQRPIVLLKKKNSNAADMKISASVAPLNPCLGVMLAYTPLHYLLLEKGPEILVMTSGNRSGEPLSIENQDALDAFCHIADYFLMHNRDIYFRADDSIVKVQAGKPRFFRRSRGYAPMPVMVGQEMPQILGSGAGLKNTVCLSKGKQVFLSQHIGDLESVKTQTYYEQSIGHLKRIFDMTPETIAHDLHPEYASTKYAAGQKTIAATAVQHHHAHAAACMAENHLEKPVLAITLDGTGFGSDGHIWGGEILQCTLEQFERKAHLSYLPMPGGDKAVLEPWRMAVSLLYKTFGSSFTGLDIPFVKQRDKKTMGLLVQMIDKKLNCPLTSSTGRLFDAVASILGIRHEITHESQAAMELEALAVKALDDGMAVEPYRFEIIPGKADPGDALFRIDMTPCVRDLVEDIQNKEDLSVMALRFHYTVTDAFCQALLVVRKSGSSGSKNVVSERPHPESIGDVVLSGGVFCNTIVLERMIKTLEKKGLAVYTHTRVPCGDGGVCLGQAAVAAARKGIDK